MNQDYSIPKNWEIKIVSEVISLEKGKKPKNLGSQDAQRSIPYLSIEAFEKGIISQYTDGINARMCKPDDILMVWDGARCGLVGWKILGAIGSTLARLRFENFLPSFIYYFFQSQYKYINTNPRGVGIPHVDPNIFWNIEIPIPPLSEQERIVARIEELFNQLDVGTAALKRTQAGLKRYKASLLKAAFEGRLATQDAIDISAEKLLNELHVKPIENEKLFLLPLGWKWIRLGDLVKVDTGATPLRSNPKYWQGGNIPWITSGAVNAARIFTAKELITIEAIKNTNTKVFPAGSLIVAMYGEGKTRGKVSELMIDSATNQACAAITFSDKNVGTKNFIKLFIEKNYDDIRRLASGGVQPNLNLSLIKNLLVPFPPIKEQERIVDAIEKNLSLISEVNMIVQENLARSERLRQSILIQAFEGKY